MEYIVCKSKVLTLTTEETMSRREKKKFDKVSHTYLHAKWNVQDFVDNLNLPCFGLYACGNIPPTFISLTKISEVFGKRKSTNGWKVKGESCQLTTIEVHKNSCTCFFFT
jgi:hypothetical protein